MTKKTFNYALGLMICAGFSASTAQASDKAPHRDAHVHGVSKLMMASDKNLVTVKLEIPGMDIVGFEHEAKTAADKKKIADAIELLKNPYNVVTFPKGAGCVVDKVKAEVGSHDHHGEHGHDDHDHDHGKKKKKKAKHDHHDHDHGKKKKKAKHDDHDHGEEEHSEFEAKYTFKCKDIKALDTVTVNLFSRFSGMKEVGARAAMANGQFSAKLKPKSNVFKLK